MITVGCIVSLKNASNEWEKKGYVVDYHMILGEVIVNWTNGLELMHKETDLEVDIYAGINAGSAYFDYLNRIAPLNLNFTKIGDTVSKIRSNDVNRTLGTIQNIITTAYYHNPTIEVRWPNRTVTIENYIDLGLITSVKEEVQIKQIVCECGKDKHGFARHLEWCVKYEKM